MTLDVEVVCDLVRQEIGPGSVALSTLVGGGSTVCFILDLVRCAMGSSFSWLDGTIVADRATLDVWMDTLGSESGGWTVT